MQGASSPCKEVMTLNAHTGDPVEFTSGVAGKAPEVIVTYKVSHVTVAAIVVGKF